MNETKYKSKRIDLLNIDVEGAEMRVLSSLSFKIYNPKIICVEILGYRHLKNDEKEKAIRENDIYKFLTNKEYKKVWSGSSYCSHLFIK